MSNPLQKWEPWLQAAGVGGLQPLVNDLLDTRQLVAPLEGRLASTRAYFMVIGEHASDRPAAQALEHWPLEQAHR